ncbi:MAG: PepSY domain-containing protein [Acetobacteraceae bacterium]|jgi:peptidase YpeB-like protein
MRKFCIPAIAAASLFALPALAMNGTAKGSSNTTPQATTQPEQQLRQDLTKAGYSDIQIMPGSFLIHAKNKQGDQTEMMISPHSMTEVTAMSTPGGSTQTGKAENGKAESGKSESVSPNLQPGK